MFEWDETKRMQSLAKHGVDFKDAEHCVWRAAFRVRDKRFEYGEERIIAIVPLFGTLHTCVYTIRNGITRVISFRKSHLKERALYEQAMDN